MRSKILYTLSLLFFAITGSVYAQDLVYQVYQFETPYQGHVVLKTLNTFISRSANANEHFGKVIPDKNLYGQAVEAEFGIGDHLEVDAYADFSKPADGKFKFTQSHFSAMYRIGERFDHFVNIALYGEYYFPKSDYSSSQEAEFRVILDKDFNDFRLALNPSVSRYTTGDESKDLNYGLSGGLYYRRLFAVQPGVEFYGKFSEHQYVIFPTADIHINPSIVLNVGAGFGLNDESDDMLYKANLAVDIQAIRPSKLFRKHMEQRARGY